MIQIDRGNIGGILRSAYFLGVDAVIINGATCGSPSGLSSRTSSGALELIPILDVSNLTSFIIESKKNGWTFYAAMPTPSQKKLDSTRTKKSKKYYSCSGLGDPLQEGPVCLVMGNECKYRPKPMPIL